LSSPEKAETGLAMVAADAGATAAIASPATTTRPAVACPGRAQPDIPEKAGSHHFMRGRDVTSSPEPAIGLLRRPGIVVARHARPFALREQAPVRPVGEAGAGKVR